MDSIIGQSKLSELPKRTYKLHKPNYIIQWDKTRPQFKKFIYIHLIRAVREYRNPHFKLTTEKLVENLAKNMGGVLKEQIWIYIENLIYQGYLSETYLNGVITLTDKLYMDLQEVDKLIIDKEIREGLVE